MKHKWQYLFLGFISGILISGISFSFLLKSPMLPYRRDTIRILSTDSNSENLIGETASASQPEDATSQNLGRIDINQADLEALMTLPNIGETRAQAIIEFRENYGNFENVDELLYVPGIGITIYSELKNFVFVQ